MKKLFFTLLGCSVFLCSASAQTYQLESPNHAITISVENGDRLLYAVSDTAGIVISPSQIALTLSSGEVWGQDSKVKKVSRDRVDELIHASFYKRSEVKDQYNALTLGFKEGFSVEFRAYNDGVAYRFISHLKRPFEIKSETAQFAFPADYTVVAPYVRDVENKFQTFEEQFDNSFENTYTFTTLSEKEAKRLMILPAAVELPGGRVACITEANLEAYPGMYLNGTGSLELNGVFALYPKTKSRDGWHLIKWNITERENYIAKVKGERAFPWRVIAIAPNHYTLPESDLVYKLADPSRITDYSWVKPGKSAYEWWSDWAIYNVPFETGVNTQTYEYMVDFAAKHKIEYILLDAGWSKEDSFDLFEVVPEIDLQRIADYANSKGVGAILWAGYRPFERDMERACKVYSQMGFKGFKVDFMDRDDQTLSEFVYESAEIAAKYKMMLDFHGMHKTTGLQRTYPHVINYEGAFNTEHLKSAYHDMPKNDVTVAMVRMVAGPTDYLAGAMINASKANYVPRVSEPMSLGTRCHQLALFVLLDAPFSMLADSPTHYEKEPCCTDFLASLPTVWDETKGLGGEIGEYMITARRKGDIWYIGGACNWDGRETIVDLSFLPEGEYEMEIIADGANASRLGCDHIHRTERLTTRSLLIHFASGGGYVAKLSPKR